MTQETTNRMNPFARVGAFTRQTVDELRKTVTPGVREWLGWTVSSLVFVLTLMLMVTAMDLGLGRLVLAVFG